MTNGSYTDADIPKHGAPHKAKSYPQSFKRDDGGYDHMGPAAPKPPPKIDPAWEASLNLPKRTAPSPPTTPQTTAAAAQPATAPHRSHEDAQLGIKNSLEWEKSQKPYKKKLIPPKFTTAEMKSFDQKMVDRISDFEDNLRMLKGDKTAEAARQEFEAKFANVLRIYRNSIKNLLDDLRSLGSGNEYEKDSIRHAESAGSTIEFAQKQLPTLNYVTAAAAFRQAHIDFQDAQTGFKLAVEHLVGQAEAAIKTLREVQSACDKLLVLFGGALEASAIKLAMIAVPVIEMAAEKLSSSWQGIPTDITWAGIVAKGIIDIGFGALGNKLDKLHFEKVDLAKAFSISDPNTRLFLAKHGYAVVQGIIKEVLNRASSQAIGQYYGQPKAALEDGIMEAAMKEYKLDGYGIMMKQLGMLEGMV